MASRVLLQRRAAQWTAALAVGGVAFYPHVAHAEAPTTVHVHSKKPIYDDHHYHEEALPRTKSTPPRTPDAWPTTTHPAETVAHTAVARLARHIGVARLSLYRQACAAEEAVNSGMARAFALERSFTSTVASLAPAADTGERLLPGLVYVAVAGMAGGIVTRSRGLVLRAAGPLVFSVAAAWALVPYTMRNVADLAWAYETRFPVVADAHVRARDEVDKAWDMATVHAHLAQRRLTGAIGDARQAVERWIAKGK